MTKALIIVESPAKIKTLKKFLGPNFLLESSIGHIRDLPTKEFGIDVENDFEPTYVVMPDKEEVIAKLKKAAAKVDIVYLSPDPDREGEAIAWHISQILPHETKIKRVSFNSITKDAVLHALYAPREIDTALVNAQQARRLLDRIVGYKISPLVNRRIQGGRDSSLSAGRVQSVALKMVVNREKEIIAFIPVEYWNLGARFQAPSDERIFGSYLYSVDGRRVEKEAVEGKDFYLIPDKQTADQLLERMKKGPYKVESVEKKEKKRYPVPPFITSTLQQEASRHFGFSSAKTMSIAQGLYEGVDFGNEGAEGLITYMRTDSVRIAPEAIRDARDYIAGRYGKEFLPDEPKVYSSKKTAQDAHEAIRPTHVRHTPENLQKYLSREQFMLYQLIWRRFVASQMVPAIYDTVTADINAGNGIVLRATGSIIKFQGFLAVYEEKQDDDEASDEARMLPPLEESQLLKLMEFTSEQSFTRPPPRYTEASLVKELEKSGIGRPSTYASIMNKIQSREYTVKESGRLKPTELGCVVVALLENNFQKIMNIGFTAEMEDSLELIAENRKDWKSLLQEFWLDFIPTVELAEKEAFVPKVMTDIDCPKCGAKLQKIWFKSKYFYGCSRYPDCDYSAQTEEINFNREDYEPDFNWEQKCPICSSEMKVRHGRFGAFLGCTRYPDCKGIVNIPKKGEKKAPSGDTDVACPAIGCPGHMVARRSRYGKTFYSCSTFPECNVIVNDLDQLETKYQNYPRTPYEKQTKRGGTKAAKTKGGKAAPKSKEAKPKKAKSASSKSGPTLKTSSDLAAVIGVEEVSRGEATKKIWDYIKAHHLQDPNNKRLIRPDAALAKVFGSKEPLDMFKIAGCLNKHLKS